jgi:DNA-binding transcriptional MocR family regulator
VEAPSFSDVPAILAAAARSDRGDWNTLDGRLPHGTVWVTDPYRNPDGSCLDPEVRRHLATLASAGHTVVVNQVYRWYLPSGTTPVVPVGAWSVTSLAKFFGGGSRLGWTTAPEGVAVAPALLVAGPAKPWQRAWAAFLDARTVEQMRTACIEPTLAARAAFTAHVGNLLGWEFVGGGPSVHLRCDGSGEQHTVEALLGAGVLVSPGSAFDAPVPSVRLAFSGTDEAGARAAAEQIATLSPRCGLNPWPSP